MASIHSSKKLDLVFEALANQHRRSIVYALGLQPFSISHLASMQKLSLPAIYKHIKILEESHMVARRKTGRVTYLSLNKDSLLSLQNWLAQYHAYWGTNKESLENYAEFLKKK